MNSRQDVDINKLNLPYDLKSLDYDACNALCSQIRRCIIKAVSENGGHLASNLGSVELSVAIHKVFDSPKDKIIWDVGHQAYAHKILTGRQSKMSTLRKKDGLSGFLRPEESEHDVVVSGHSSTAISSALGFAYAMKMQGDNHHAIAVIGDGSFSGGLAYEGLNNAGKSNTNIIVILNYNEMSISKSNGAMAKYLAELRTSEGYRKTKGVMQTVLDNTPIIGKPIKNTLKASKNAVKDMIFHSTMFEEFGFVYLGPCNGHNVEELCNTLQFAKEHNKPVFIMVNTTKGKGYQYAEENPGEYHGIGAFDIKTGKRKELPSLTYSDVFGKKLCELAKKDSRIDAITAAMKYGTGLQYFSKQFPNRFYDVGISESHAATFAAALSIAGRLPVFAVYSTFLQRSYDQIMHDLSISNTHVIFAIDRAGVVGDDGETHNGLFDIAFLSTIPNVTVFSPFSAKELEMCLEKALYKCDDIACVRYPRGTPSGFTGLANNTEYEYIPDSNGRCENLIVTYGRISENAKKAIETLRKQGKDCALLRLVRIIPVPDEAIEICKKAENIFFFEETSENGCIAQSVITRLALEGVKPDVSLCAVKGFVKHMTVSQALSELGLDEEGIVSKVMSFK